MPQRRLRRQTLTARGRATLFVLLACLAGLAAIALPRENTAANAPTARAAEPPHVASGAAVAAPVELVAVAPPPELLPAPRRESSLAAAPEELLAHVPYAKSALALRATDATPAQGRGAAIDPALSGRLIELVAAPAGYSGPLRVEYALDADLMRRVFDILDKARVKLGHVVVLDVKSGRVMAYASANPAALPPERAYPAASLAKVVTGAAALEHDRRRALVPCLYQGNPYRLTRARVHPMRGGNVASLEKALAGSYNQCFAQLAVHALGADATVDAFERFGWSGSPAPGHGRARIERGEGDYGLGKLGSGLAPSRITALHAAQLAASLDTGELIEPWWIDRIVDANGTSLVLPERAERHRVMQQRTANEMRKMLKRTTTHGTARRAFRTRSGARLGDVRVAGKTGNLSGTNPSGRYEWFAGVAPADDPRIAIAVVQVQGQLWWRTSAQIASDVLAELFCEGRRCDAERVARFTGDLGPVAAPVFLNGTAGTKTALH